jgi:MoxR-like ATPase
MEPSQAISGGPGTAPSPGETAPPAGDQVPGTRRSGIPAPVTALIGRRRECEGVAAALDSSRVVTLMGPGGVGKTRLALAVALQL